MLDADVVFLFFFKQKTAYEMRISDWSSDVCSSDLEEILRARASGFVHAVGEAFLVGATTNSSFGVTDFARCDAVFAAMEETGLPLLQIGRASCRERVCQYV